MAEDGRRLVLRSPPTQRLVRRAGFSEEGKAEDSPHEMAAVPISRGKSDAKHKITTQKLALRKESLGLSAAEWVKIQPI